MANACRLTTGLISPVYFTFSTRATIQQPVARNGVPMAPQAFDYGEVKLLDGTLKRAFEKKREKRNRSVRLGRQAVSTLATRHKKRPTPSGANRLRQNQLSIRTVIHRFFRIGWSV